MRILILAAALAVISSPAVSAPATTTATEAAIIKPSEAEALAFVQAYSPSELRRQAELSILEHNFVPGMRKNPDFAALLDAYPKLGPELTEAMASQIDLYMKEYNERFHPRATALVRGSLSEDDVRELTAFYNSALGRKMLTMAAENIDASEIIERATKNEKIDEGVAQRQTIRSGITAISHLSDDERAKFFQLVQSPAGQHLKAMLPELRSIQTELMNNPGPAFQASTKKAIAAAFKRVTGLDPAQAEGK
jgi:hypothetical protein